MTAREVIEDFRESYPSPLGEDTLSDWLRELEGKIILEIVATHEGAPAVRHIFTDDSPLTAAEPYSALYAAYLRMKCDLEFGDTTRYKTSGAVFAAAFADFANHYNREHAPLQRARLGTED